MAYVRVDNSRVWRGQDGLVLCPQVIRILYTDNPYLCFDFTDVLHGDVSISSPVMSEPSGTGNITLSAEDVDDQGRRVSFKATPSTAEDFTIACKVTLSDGTSSTISLRGVLRALT
jgi:hypothetical protein